MSSFNSIGEQAISSTSSYVETYMDCKYISNTFKVDATIVGREVGLTSMLLRCSEDISLYMKCIKP